jgi:hypothetical protein
MPVCLKVIFLKIIHAPGNGQRKFNTSKDLYILFIFFLGGKNNMIRGIIYKNYLILPDFAIIHTRQEFIG